MQLIYSLIFCVTAFSHFVESFAEMNAEEIKHNYALMVCLSDDQENKYVGVFSCQQIMESPHVISIEKRHCIYQEDTWQAIAVLWKHIKKPAESGYYFVKMMHEKNKKKPRKPMLFALHKKDMLELKNVVFSDGLNYEKGILLPLHIIQNFELFMLDLHDSCSNIECARSMPDIVQTNEKKLAFDQIMDQVALVLFIHYLHLKNYVIASFGHFKAYSISIMKKLCQACADE